MKRYDYDMIVIGGGSGGLSVSAGAGQLGLKTLLIEKEERLGGDCLHYGCVPSKTLIKSASCYHIVKNAEKYGLPKVEVPQVDFKNIAGRIKGVIDTIQKHDSPEQMKKYNVETRFGKAAFIDDHTVELEGKKITSRIFVIATGSSPFIPPIEGIQDVPYVTNMNIFSMEALPPSLCVLGGGPIAMEMAQSLGRFGSEVTVVELMDQILPKEDQDVASFITRMMEKEGIRIFTGTKAVKVEREAETIKVTVDRKGKKSTLEAKALLVATGRKPTIEGLALAKAGVNHSPNGISVDKHLRTNRKNIYACGDVTGGYQFTHVASYQAGIIISSAILHLPIGVDYKNITWCTFLDPEVASAGLNETEAKKRSIKYTVHKAEFNENDRARAEAETKGFIKILTDAKDTVIGVQIIGPHAGELIHEWVAVLNGKIGLSRIAQAIHVYPTLSEINKKISGDYFAPRLFSKKTRRILKFLFKYQG